MSQNAPSLQDLLTTYLQGPDQLEAALDGLTDADLDKRGSDGWSIRQIVHHLTDGDAMWSLFMKAAIITPGCTFNFDWYHNNDTASQALHYAERPIKSVLQLFRANRNVMAQLLAQIEAVDSKYLLINATTDPSIEPESIYVPHIIELLTEHVQEHVAEIKRLRNTN